VARPAAHLLLALTAVALLSGCDLGGEDEESALHDAQFVASFDDAATEESDSGLGGVGLAAQGAKTLVTIELEAPRAPRQQAEIRQGNCQVVGGGVAYALRQVDDGTSETVVDAPIGELRRRGYLVIVHDTAADRQIRGICADLAKAQPPDAAPAFE
jgi:hypothetical protein